MTSYLITGSSRGIGLEITRQLVESNAEITIFAAARSATSPGFQDLLERHPTQIIHVPLEVTSENSIKAAVSLVTEKLNGRGLDVLINNAGVMNAARLEDMTDLDETFRINVSGVHSVTRAFLPIMREGREKKILNMSSTVGSIALQPDFRMTPVPSYKVTKAALNMLTVLYADELKDEGFTVFCVSPGWLKTELGGEHADLPVETGVKSVLEILSSVGGEDNGQFFNIEVPGWEKYQREKVPW
ncbi:hypothetical protein ASPVEDRAFT_126259 [Aspergillus versicolor CBS 583.65]|uniref:Short chain oxidoreductase n=1 Tax=Aspergillus versicolor CBS 583.65 TaxID=1036611 RepID=A0A1L9PDB4_ASPVE|nr:uncharacterized protein ASPVEDRAFT_126259 [Aspergillus versicolor CBS 583.65]OJI99510.1 hypothetical protein ASPVEDRAFT_126259 [Aspergillus versicolor CBS 583.65]